MDKSRWITREFASIDSSHTERWFGSSKEFDQQIRENFEKDLEHLLNDKYRYPGDLDHPHHI